MDFIEERTAFPNGAHDDQVDAVTQALLRLQTPSSPELAPVVIILRRDAGWRIQ